MRHELSRRNFLQLSASSSALLAIGAGVSSLSGCSQQVDTDNGYRVLRRDDVYFLGAIAPAILTTLGYPGGLQDDARGRLISKLDEIMSVLSHHSRKQLILLLDLMNSAPTRVAVGAPWHPWYEADLADAERFLQHWRNSSMGIKRMGYAGITKLFCMAWYSQPESFTVSGYPGPPQRAPMTQIASR